jgi:PAS domain S-box-containing protein
MNSPENRLPVKAVPVPPPATNSELRLDFAAARMNVAQLDETLRAIRADEVDALFVGAAGGDRLFTLAGANSAYRQLVEEMAEGALTLTPDGVVLYANRHLAELLGRPLEQLIGAGIEPAFAPEGHAALRALLARAGAAKQRAELDLLDGQGRRVPTLLSVSPLSMEGLPGALCMVITDLTGQRRSEVAAQARHVLLELVERQQAAEAGLQASLATLRLRDSALGAISQGVLIADSRGHVTYMNQACEDIAGYSLQDLAGRSAGSVLQGPATEECTRLALREAVAEARPFHGEILNYRKDGTPFWNELSVTPVFDELGMARQFVGVMRDVTARRQAEAQVLLAAKLFEQSSEGFIVTDADCRIVKVNQAFTTISGFSEAEALGQNPRMLSSGRHDAAFFQVLWHEVGRSGRWQGEVWNRRKDGSIYPQWLSMSRVGDAALRTTHYIAAFSDIT